MPRADKEWTVIWARPRAEAERLLQLDQTTLSDEINAAFGPNMGALKLTAKATSYPLVWRFVEPRASGAIVALGNAAQGLHPPLRKVSTGLRDAQDLRTLQPRGGATRSIAPTLAKFARKRAGSRSAD